MGDSTCLDDGTTDAAKLQAAWTEMSNLYAGVTDTSEQNLLKNASIVGTDPINKFAALYNYILNKYPSYQQQSSNFIGRAVTPVAVSTRTPMVIDNDNMTSNIITAISIGASSIAVVGLYFFVKKKKENK